MKSNRIFLFIGLLVLTILSCRAVSVQVKTKVVCQVPKDFLPANSNIWNIYRKDGSLGGVIEYKNEKLSVYTEPGHTLSRETPVKSTGAIAVTMTVTEQGSSEVYKTIDVIVCGGSMYVRESSGQPQQPLQQPLQQGSLYQKEGAFGALPFYHCSDFSELRLSLYLARSQ